MRGLRLLVVGVTAWSAMGTTVAQLDFTPAPGFVANEVWSGSGVAHFAIEGGALYIYGAEAIGGGQFQNVVRLFDGAATTEIARSPAYAQDTYFPDAIAVANGEVYWTHATSYPTGSHANLCKTTFDGLSWTTTEIIDESASIGVYGLCTNGQRVFGTGLSAANVNVSFYLDETDGYNVFAELPADASGGCGFDPEGDFFAGAWSVGGDYDNHMYRYSAQQVSERLTGIQPGPYTSADAIADFLVSGNGSPVMESDGTSLFGTQYNSTWTGLDPYTYDLQTGITTSLGTLSGAATNVVTDMYARDGSVYFLGKNDWGTGSEAVIYTMVPEPSSLYLLAVGLCLLPYRRLI